MSNNNLTTRYKMKIVFPWYPAQVKPNWSGHYMTKAKYKAIYRQVCKEQTLKAMETQENTNDYTEMTFVFSKPNKRNFDLDNCLSSAKSLVDGMADALGINDKCFKVIHISFAEQIGGFITVELK